MSKNINNFQANDGALFVSIAEELNKEQNAKGEIVDLGYKIMDVPFNIEEVDSGLWLKRDLPGLEIWRMREYWCLCSGKEPNSLFQIAN